MGVYLAPLLVERGFAVDVTSRTSRVDTKNIHYITGDAHDTVFLTSILEPKKYDVIIDFMVYATDEFEVKMDILLENTSQYIYLSSYRVFADTEVITETSPRLLDTVKDPDYLTTDEYALAKARQEDMLKASTHTNWTIVRPAITYSTERFQLGTLEADTVIWRTLLQKRVILPDEILAKVTTMTWAGDVATMIAGLILNKKAYSEDFNLATKENHTWQEIADLYGELIGLRLKRVSLEEYIKATEGEFQVKYDRMYNRKVDNAKILSVVGPIKFTSLKQGLKGELGNFMKNASSIPINYALQARIDTLTYEIMDVRSMSKHDAKVYIKYRFPWTGSAFRFSKKTVNKTRSVIRLRTRIRQVSLKTLEYKSKVLLLKDARRLAKINGNPQGATVTLIDYSNYGNVLQRYALQEFLYKSGYQFTSLEHDLPIASTLAEEKHRYIVEFVDRYIARRPFDPREQLTAYVVGSDQVWRNWHYGNEAEQLGFFFLDFLTRNDVKRVAYAASFGKGTLKDAAVSAKFTKQAKQYVDKFTAISMREKSGAKILEEAWGISSDEVIDPTLLLRARDYDRLVQHSTDCNTPTAPIFVYVLGPTEENKTLIGNLSEAMKVPADIINPYHLDKLPSVAVWLKGIRDAQLVITDSFHSTVFSIINNTPFIVIENEVGGIGRVEDLLTLVGISHDRIVRRHHELEYEITKTQDIDWILVNKRLYSLRKESASWLLGALKK